MSIRDVMMLNSKTTTMPLDKRIEGMLLPAGYDGFSRTAFERSSFNVPAQGREQHSFTLSKFIAQIEGMYKISFDYQFYNAGNPHIFKGELSLCGVNVPFTKSTYYSTTRSTSIEGNVKGNWYFEQSIGIGQTVLYGSGYKEEMLKLEVSENSAEWKSKTYYFQLRKGDAYAVSGEIRNAWHDTAANFSFKNFKITY